jgi:uncharacterized beta-barrel protein YwiB (DUF1934 family)
MKDVKLKIKSADNIEFITDGSFSFLDDIAFLNYKESEISGMDGCVTSLIVHNDTVKMKRMSANEPTDIGEMSFVPGVRYEGMYKTPYGDVPMEILTKNVRNNITSDGGDVKIDYSISLHGLTETTNSLLIEIMAGSNTEQ